MGLVEGHTWFEWSIVLSQKRTELSVVNSLCLLVENVAHIASVGKMSKAGTKARQVFQILRVVRLVRVAKGYETSKAGWTGEEKANFMAGAEEDFGNFQVFEFVMVERTPPSM